MIAVLLVATVVSTYLAILVPGDGSDAQDLAERQAELIEGERANCEGPEDLIERSRREREQLVAEKNDLTNKVAALDRDKRALAVRTVELDAAKQSAFELEKENDPPNLNDRLPSPSVSAL